MPDNGPPSLLPVCLDDVSYAVNGRTLLDRISLKLGLGGPTFILGPNGAGKTLLMRTCHGLLAPTSGSIRWGAADRASALARQAMVFQRPILLRRSAQANIEHALTLRGVPRDQISARAGAALHAVGLSEFARRPARSLSGGEQQRVAVARAWALQPELLLLDEPTANLDPGATHAIESAILRLQEAGVALVLTSHDLSHAKRLAQRVVFLHHGRVLEDAAAERFFAEPGTPEARAFLRGELVP